MDNQCSALRLNDYGVYRLLDHNFAEAVVFFHDAVYLTEAILIQQQDSSSADQQKCNPAAHTRLDLELDFIDLECYHKATTHESFSNVFGSGDHMLCKAGISISLKADFQDGHLASDGRASSNQVAIAAAVTYNLAMAFHLWALQLGSTEKLRLALYYYEIAYRLQCQQKETTQASFSLVMSILNNVANIYNLLGDHGLSKLFLQELMGMLPYVDNACQSMMNRRNQGISWENILCLMLGPPTAASAA